MCVGNHVVSCDPVFLFVHLTGPMLSTWSPHNQFNKLKNDLLHITLIYGPIESVVEQSYLEVRYMNWEKEFCLWEESFETKLLRERERRKSVKYMANYEEVNNTI